MDNTVLERMRERHPSCLKEPFSNKVWSEELRQAKTRARRV